MNEVIQLLSFFASFCFGFFFHILTLFHFKLTDTYPVWLKYLTTLLFILDITLSYLLILYYLNGGIVHIYFVTFVFLGFGAYSFVSKNVKNTKISSLKIVKKINRLYNPRRK